MSHQTIILMNLFDLQTNPDLKKFRFIIDQSEDRKNSCDLLIGQINFNHTTSI